MPEWGVTSSARRLTRRAARTSGSRFVVLPVAITRDRFGDDQCIDFICRRSSPHSRCLPECSSTSCVRSCRRAPRGAALRFRSAPGSPAEKRSDAFCTRDTPACSRAISPGGTGDSWRRAERNSAISWSTVCSRALSGFVGRAPVMGDSRPPSTLVRACHRQAEAVMPQSWNVAGPLPTAVADTERFLCHLGPCAFGAVRQGRQKRRIGCRGLCHR